MIDRQCPERGPAIPREHADLENAGFRPARHAGLVSLVRRVLWPFIRPFHLHTLDQVRGLSHTVTRHHDELRSLLSAHIAPQSELNAYLRSELLALRNRHLALEAASEAALQRISALDQRFAQRPRHGDLFLHANDLGLFLLKDGDLISESVVASGTWDPHIVPVARRAAAVARARAGAPAELRAVDAGAHFGVLSVTLAQYYDRVISFEANVFNERLLRANIALNGLTGRVDVRHAALGARPGRVSLSQSEQQEIPLPLDASGCFNPASAANLGAYSFSAAGTGISEVDAITLDSLDPTGVAFIKVDVQGADGEVLMGAMDTIGRCRPWVVFEWESELSRNFSVRLEDVRARLEGLGYVVRELKKHNEKQTDHLAIPAVEAAASPLA